MFIPGNTSRFLVRCTSTRNIEAIRNSFSKSQIVSIGVALILIAKSDGEPNKREITFLTGILSFLGINIDDPALTNLITDDAAGREKMISLLDSLSEIQKDWFAFISYGMVMIDLGLFQNVNERELGYVYGLCQKIGISEDRFDLVAERSMRKSSFWE